MTFPRGDRRHCKAEGSSHCREGEREGGKGGRTTQRKKNDFALHCNISRRLTKQLTLSILMKC